MSLAIAAKAPSALQILLLHTKYELRETFRIPIAVIGSLAFPALALLFFVVPNRAVANDPEYATAAIIAMAVFAVMSNALFSFGIGVAESREKAWDPYLRTLPATPSARIWARVLSGSAMGLLALVPVLLIGIFFTAAQAEPLRIVLGFVAIAVAALPFMFIGISIGYAMPMKAAMAVVQILMFGLAFLGGLFLPPSMFPSWLEFASRFTPSRDARDMIVSIVQGTEMPWWALVGIVAWTVVSCAVAIALFRRDEGRNYR